MTEVLHIPAAEYHARSEWSNSKVKLLPEQVDLFNAYHIARTEPVPTLGRDAELGTVVHDVILEGGEVPLIPRDVLNEKGHRKGKPWLEYAAEHKGEILLTDPEAYRVRRMVESIRKEPYAARLLDPKAAVESEVSIIRRHEASGLDIRCRVDRIDETCQGIVPLDIKTTRINPRNIWAWEKEVYERRYYRQAAWYWDMVTMEIAPPWAWCFVVVQNVAPFSCNVWELNAESRALQLGRKENDAALVNLAQRLETNNFLPDGYGRVDMQDLPEYAYHKQEEANDG